MEQVRCQAMKENSLQCTNAAFVKVNGIAYCRLDFNWLVGQKKLDLSPESLANSVFPINPEDQKDVDKIIASGRENKEEEKG